MGEDNAPLIRRNTPGRQTFGKVKHMADTKEPLPQRDPGTNGYPVGGDRMPVPHAEPKPSK